MKKRILSILLLCCMVLTLLPTAAFAEGSTEELPVCTCETACMAESMNDDCSVCGAEGASAENCAKYADSVNGEGSGTGTSRQALTNVAITFPTPEAGKPVGDGSAVSANADSGLTLYLFGPALWKQGEEPDKLDENAAYAEGNTYLLNFTFYTQKPITDETVLTYNGKPITRYADYQALTEALDAYDGKQDAYLGCVLFSAEGTGDPAMEDLKDLYLLSLYAFVRVPEAQIPEDTVDEQFTLTSGGTYYFDLSGVSIPGTANESLPDKTMRYVPFTYAGTVDAYKLTSAMATTEEYAQQNKYSHSLFVADYAVTHKVNWNNLDTASLIFGKNYASGGVDYTLRAPSCGSGFTGSDDSERGTPQSNEWDAVLDKNSGYVKNWNDIYSWGQDTSSYESWYRAVRGYDSARDWSNDSAMHSYPNVGFRPVLELPTDLAADSLKVVEVRLGGTKIPGETGNWINIIVKKGESFTAPSADGLPRPNDVSPDTPMWWTDGNGNYYKPGSTVPADVSMIYPLWGGFGLLLDRGDGAVEVTPDNYTDIFGDGSASFVLPKGETFDDLINYYQLSEAARHKIYSTGKYGENIFPNLKLKNAELTSVTLNRRYIEQVSPFFITLDGKNTIGSLSGVRGRSMTLSILGGGTLALNSISDFGIYAQNDVSVTIADALNVGRLYMFSGSLTVTDDTQAVTLGDTFDGYYPLNVRVFAGNSAQDAVEVTGWQLSPEMLALYQRFYAGETLTNDENSTLKKAIKDQWDVIRTKLSGKPYARFTQAWDVTYQPGTNGKGDGVTDVKFYGDALTLRDKLFTRSGYTQVGWATADGGEKIYDLSGVYTTDAALTLYPVWTRSSSGGSSGSSSPSYAVTVPDKTEHGTVTANRRYAEKGDTVTITVTPDSGYVLETITATDKNGNDLKLTDKGGGKYTFTMPASKVEVKATFMEDNSVLNFFYDVPNDAYYYEAVKWAAENGITGGVGNSLFAPNQPCTRAQIVTFLWRAAGSPVVNYLMPFTDVDEGAYYAEAVRWAASTGIVTGLTEMTFGTDSVCTRAQAAAMLYRCAQAQGKGFTGAWMFHLPFTDVPEWAYESVAWCYMNGVTTGVSETSFAPGNDCTRAQIVTFLWRCKK